MPTFYVSLLTQTWIFAIVAMSLDLLVGFTGLVNFSQAALFGVGAYAVAIGATRFHITAFAPVVALGIVSAIVTAAIFGLVALRSEGVGFIIITIALNEIVWGLAYQWVSVSGGDNGITGIVRPHVGPFDVSANTGYYYVCLAFFVIALLLLLVLVRSPFGLVLKGRARDAAPHARAGLQRLALPLSRDDDLGRRSPGSRACCSRGTTSSSGRSRCRSTSRRRSSSW